MTNEEKELYSVFMKDGVIDEKAIYIFEMENGDIFKVEYYGEGETELNPFTGDDDYFYSLDFYIVETIENKNNKYKTHSIIEISKYIYPKRITKIC